MKTNKHYYVLLLFIVISCIGCDKNKEHITDYFSESSEKLNHKVFHFSNSEEILNPVGLMTYDSLLFVQNLRSPQFFSLININQEKLIRHFGNSGEGPGEFLINIQIDKVKSKQCINAPEATLKRMYQYSIDSLLKIKNVKPKNIFQQSPNKAAQLFFHGIQQINDSIFIGMGGYTGKRFTIFNRYNNKYTYFGDFPDKSEVSLDFKGSAYQGAIKYNEYSQKLVFISNTSEMLEFYDCKNDRMNLLKGYYTSIPVYKFVEEGGTRHIASFCPGKHFMSLTYTKNYVYILYVQKEDDASIFEKCKGDCILVFDWKGKPIKKYQLDCEVKTIEINEDGSRIYAIRNNPDPEIIYFNIGA